MGKIGMTEILLVLVLTIFFVGYLIKQIVGYLTKQNKNTKNGIDEPQKPTAKQEKELFSHQDTVKKYEKLKAVKSLLDDGILTQEEFDKEKQIILDN